MTTAHDSDLEPELYRPARMLVAPGLALALTIIGGCEQPLTRDQVELACDAA